jgi:hypothetical protein
LANCATVFIHCGAPQVAVFVDKPIDDFQEEIGLEKEEREDNGRFLFL